MQRQFRRESLDPCDELVLSNKGSRGSSRSSNKKLSVSSSTSRSSNALATSMTIAKQPSNQQDAICHMCESNSMSSSSKQEQEQEQEQAH